MTVTEATLTEITRRLVATYQPEQVVLFGSHAWGEPGFPSVDGRPTVGHSRPRVSADPCA